jgi:hypothetical protein
LRGGVRAARAGSVLDDRALMERLIRFTRAHGFLKKNTERAQKLVQESNVAPETYQWLARSDGMCVLHLLVGMGGWRESADFFFEGITRRSKSRN